MVVYELVLLLLPISPWKGSIIPTDDENSSRNTYNLQEAINVADHYEYSNSTTFANYMFYDDCTPNGSHAMDCSSVCEKDAFRDIETLHNCASVAFLADNLTTSDSDDEPSYKLSNPDQVPILPDVENFSDMHLATPDRNATANATAAKIYSCLRSKCDQSPNCKSEIESDEEGSDWQSHATPWSQRLFSYGQDLVYYVCTNLGDDIKLDNDIGGIGVYISYWVHVGLALLLFVTSLTLKYIAPSVIKLVYSRSKDRTNRIESAELTLATKYIPSIVAAVVDFHKTQCIFMAAINVAAIKIVKRGGLEPKNLQQIYLNYGFLKLIAVGGYLPVTFTLFNLHLVHDIYWYPTFLAFASIVVATGSLSVLGQFSINDRDKAALDVLYNKDGTPDCDGKQPWIYCFTSIGSGFSTSANDYTNKGNIDTMVWMLYKFSVVVFVLILCYKTCRSLWHNENSMRALQRCWEKLRSMRKMPETVRRQWSSLQEQRETRAMEGQEPLSMFSTRQNTGAMSVHHDNMKDVTSPWPYVQASLQQKRYQIFTVQLIRLLTYWTFTGLYGWFFGLFMKNLKWFADNHIYSTVWNFGQVVAVAVWVPPICELINNLLDPGGLEGAYEHKTPKPYFVTMNSSTQSIAGNRPKRSEWANDDVNQESTSYSGATPLQPLNRSARRTETSSIEQRPVHLQDLPQPRFSYERVPSFGPDER
ncbi:uncharacterized protein KY384_007841 [Bacidia gigantensis]|uniref:uncharacterized protein n=1 Tax=Bacidia gigantensis TaxID=2732470 RepID=UPI001D0469FD|nr:uncharacterized protein KY384_007841 [Bacidia gigantensis]KAG8527687.1 hypothetical protein KY384_007841 [Bacidia gigantensis]